jgi:hypothetical protein
MIWVPSISDFQLLKLKSYIVCSVHQIINCVLQPFSQAFKQPRMQGILLYQQNFQNLVTRTGHW